jgi:acetylornithine/N-succinyldiaminopimelate aminotransferase
MSSLVERWPDAVMNTYGAPTLALVRGAGAVVTDETGTSYVDLIGGIAVNALGHAHPAVVAAVSEQIATLGHVSNLYAHPAAVTLAERLLSLAGRPGRVFFANSGAEANEAAF